MLFKDELKRLRESAGMTQEALARAAGTSLGNVRNYEQGIRLPSFPIVVKLAKALGVDCRAFAACENVGGNEPEGEAAAVPPEPGTRPRSAKKKPGKGKK